MKKFYLLFLFFAIFSTKGNAQGATCAQATPICAGGPSLTFQNAVNYPNGGAIACLGSTPNAAWFYLQCGLGGNLDFTISQTNTAGTSIDVDFVAWGPFLSPTCSNQNLVPSSLVGCSYSTSSVESLSIVGSLPGKYYMILITNFANLPGQITFTQTNIGQPGSGTTNCDIICPLLVTGGGTFCPGYPAILNATIAAATSYSWSSSVTGPIPGNTQSITVTQPAVYTVVVNKPGCVANATASATYAVAPVPDMGVPNSLSVNAPSNIFNLTLNTPVIQNGNSSLLVDYHTTPASAAEGSAGGDLISNPSAYVGSNGQIIYTSTEDNNACIFTDSFPLTIASSATSAPSAVSPQYFSTGATIQSLLANGQNIRWYSSASNRQNQQQLLSMSLSPSTPLVDGATYYASQTVNGVESINRTPVLAVLTTLSETDFSFSGLTCLPNPVKNTMQVSNSYMIDRLEIVSVLGQVLVSNKINALQTEIDLSDLSKGVYVLRIVSAGHLKTLKIIKG